MFCLMSNYLVPGILLLGSIVGLGPLLRGIKTLVRLHEHSFL